MVILLKKAKNILASPTTRNVARVLCGSVLAKAFYFFTTLILIRKLTVEEFAAFAAFHAVRVLAARFAGEGISTVMVRYGTEYSSQTGQQPRALYRTAVLTEMALYLALLIPGMIFSRQIAMWIFGRPEYQHLVVLGLLAGIGYLLIQAGQKIYQSQERFNSYVGILWMQYLLTLAYLVVLLLMDRVTFPLVARGIIVLDLLVGGWVLLQYVARKAPRNSSRLQVRLSEIIRAASWLIAYQVTLIAFSQLDVMMLSHFSSERELAIYSAAFKYYTMALLALGAIHAVLLPKFARVEMQDFHHQQRFAWRWIKYAAWLIVPLAVIDLVGRPAFVWVNGARYDSSFDIWIIFSLGVWLSVLCSPLNNILVSRRRFRTLFGLGSLAFVINILGNLFLIPYLGGKGAAIATITSHAILNGISAWLILIGRGGTLPNAKADMAAPLALTETAADIDE